MQDYEHRVLVIVSKGVVFLRFIVCSSRRKRRVETRGIVRGNDEVDGEFSCEGRVLGAEDMSFVIYRDIIASGGGPEGLQVTVEQEGVEGAGGRRGLREGE